MILKREMMLPDFVYKIVNNKDITNIVKNHYQTIGIKHKLWAPCVETYTSFLIDFDLHKKLAEESIKRKISSETIIRNILYKEYRR